MSKTVFACVWSFILGMTVFDVCFAYFNQEFMSEWELNAIAFWVMTNYGFGAVIAYKAVWFAILLLALCRAERLLEVATWGLGFVHLVLLGMYLL